MLTFRLSSLRFLDPFDPFCLSPLSSVLSFVTLSTPSRIITYPRIANRCRVGSSLVQLFSVSDSLLGSISVVGLLSLGLEQLDFPESRNGAQSFGLHVGFRSRRDQLADLM